MISASKRLLKRVLPKPVVGNLGYWINRGRTTYSQFGEDIFIARLLPEATGFYVDIGAFHPKFGSNTYGLYQRGWRGINVDVDRYKIDLFDRYRKGDINVVAGVSSENTTRTFYVQRGESYGSMSSFEADFAKSRAEALQRSVEAREVRVTTLDDLLAKHLPSNPDGSSRTIDFVNIDVEGHEYAILGALDFDRYRPRCWCIEIHADSIDALQADRSYQLLADQGYALVAWPAPSCLFFDRR